MRGTVTREFEDRLQREFDGRLRLRWSNRAGEFQVEQKVGVGREAPISDNDEDDLVRARDGYAYVMSVRDGDRMPCPTCNYTVQVPYLEVAHIRCPYCKFKGRNTYMVAGYFPLNDNFINYLKERDPLRGASKELAAAMDRRNEALAKSAEQAHADRAVAAFDDSYRRVVGIPQTGYTGKILEGTQVKGF